ncbi:MAG: hypothetical protein L0Z53_03050 [Acidobacteriales bacterium]|nr:hypothetical protein [Terriglobales bacterium]
MEVARSPRYLASSALQRWNKVHGAADESLALDGKMCNAIDKQGHRTQNMGIVRRQGKSCYIQSAR